MENLQSADVTLRIAPLGFTNLTFCHETDERGGDGLATLEIETDAGVETVDIGTIREITQKPGKVFDVIYSGDRRLSGKILTPVVIELLGGHRYPICDVKQIRWARDDPPNA